MPEIQEFRDAKLTYGTDNVTFAIKASIKEKWETLSYPKYLDQDEVTAAPLLKKITAKVRRRFQPSSPLHAALDGSPLTLAFESGGETHTFTVARVVEWKITGILGGEMIEEVSLVCESES